MSYLLVILIAIRKSTVSDRLTIWHEQLFEASKKDTIATINDVESTRDCCQCEVPMSVERNYWAWNLVCPILEQLHTAACPLSFIVSVDSPDMQLAR